jgi:hypothetical protein
VKYDHNTDMREPMQTVELVEELDNLNYLLTTGEARVDNTELYGWHPYNRTLHCDGETFHVLLTE